MLWPTTCCSRVNTSGDVETQLYKITEQAILLKRRLLQRVFLELFDFDCSGFWGPLLQSAFQTQIMLLIIILSFRCIVFSQKL